MSKMQTALRVASTVCNRTSANSKKLSINTEFCSLLYRQLAVLAKLLHCMHREIQVSRNQQSAEEVIMALGCLVEELEQVDLIISRYCHSGKLVRALWAKTVKLELETVVHRLCNAVNQLKSIQLQIIQKYQNQLQSIRDDLYFRVKYNVCEDTEELTEQFNTLQYELKHTKSNTPQNNQNLKQIILKAVNSNTLKISSQDIKEIQRLKNFSEENNTEDIAIFDRILNICFDFKQQSKRIFDLDVSNSLFQDAFCPITEEIMRDPVMLVESGHTYERQAIEEWLVRRGCRTDPLTNKKLQYEPQLVQNITLKKLINSWQEHKLLHQQESPRKSGSSSGTINEIKINNGGLIISPPELQFKCLPNIKQSGTVLLSLTNIQSYPIAFKIKTRDRNKYSINPAKQIIQPGNSIDLKIIINAEDNSPEEIFNFRDKLLIQQVPSNSNSNFLNSVSEIFRLNGNQLIESKIKIKYSHTVGAGDLIVIPGDLEFKFKHGISTQNSIFLCNQGDEKIAFKIKTRLPTKYIVKPGKGFIEGNQIQEIKIIIPPDQDIPIDVESFKDKILVQTVIVQQNDKNFQFDKLTQDYPGVVDAKLGVLLL